MGQNLEIRSFVVLFVEVKDGAGKERTSEWSGQMVNGQPRSGEQSEYATAGRYL